MDKVIDITNILILKKAIRILEMLDKDYDYELLKKHPEICKEIVILFQDDLDKLSK